ncbi:MAG: hypothetical protein RLZZ214_4264, partial [Verrucomicrobiota bacterium]
NTTATISILAQAADRVREGGKSLLETSGVRLLRLENGRAELAVSSGTYQFESN